MKLTKSSFMALVGAFLATIPCRAQDFRHRMDYVIDSMLSHHTISANIMIASDVRPLFERNVGFADISTAKPLQKSNAFQ